MGGLAGGAGRVGPVVEVAVGGLAVAGGGGGGGWIVCDPPPDAPKAAVELLGGMAIGGAPKVPADGPPVPDAGGTVPWAAEGPGLAGTQKRPWQRGQFT